MEHPAPTIYGRQHVSMLLQNGKSFIFYIGNQAQIFAHREFRFGLVVVLLASTIPLPSHCTRGACKLPHDWHGQWFEFGEREAVIVSSRNVSHKGHCVTSKTDKFIFHDRHMTSRNLYAKAACFNYYFNIMNLPHLFILKSILHVLLFLSYITFFVMSNF